MVACGAGGITGPVGAPGALATAGVGAEPAVACAVSAMIVTANNCQLFATPW